MAEYFIAYFRSTGVYDPESRKHSTPQLLTLNPASVHAVNAYLVHLRGSVKIAGQANRTKAANRRAHGGRHLNIRPAPRPMGSKEAPNSLKVAH